MTASRHLDMASAKPSIRQLQTTKCLQTLTLTMRDAPAHISRSLFGEASRAGNFGMGRAGTTRHIGRSAERGCAESWTLALEGDAAPEDNVAVRRRFTRSHDRAAPR